MFSLRAGDRARLFTPVHRVGRRAGATATAITIAVASIAVARPAAGQLCHLASIDHADAAARDAAAPSTTTARTSGDRSDRVQASLAVEAAVLDIGDLQGITPALDWQHGRFAARISAPAYHVAHLTGEAWGAGDVTVGGRARLIDAGPVRAGVVATVGLPTGDADAGLGMGHTMFMPGAWAVARHRRMLLAASTTLGVSLSSGEHHHHAAMVNPMNPLEVGGSARAGYIVGDLELHGTGLVAVPIGDGVTRAIAGGGVRLALGAWSFGAEADAGLYGRPFITRGIFDATRTF